MAQLSWKRDATIIIVKNVSLNGIKKNKLEGKVTAVLLRAKTKFIGVIEDNGKNAFFIADNKNIGSDFFIPREKLNSFRFKWNIQIYL